MGGREGGERALGYGHGGRERDQKPGRQKARLLIAALLELHRQGELVSSKYGLYQMSTSGFQKINPKHKSTK
jgi:hypothetical protein